MKLHTFPEEFRELITVVANEKHISESAVERDYYIVMMLKALADSPYDENLPCMVLLMQESADIQYDSDISFDIADVSAENRRNIMRTLGSTDPRSDVEDYEREIRKYIATPIDEQLNSYEFTIQSLRPNETKWIGALIALKPKAERIFLRYSIRSKHSDGQISDTLEYVKV